MKKLISSIIFTLLLFSCLSLTVFAETSVTLSEDYQTLSYNGKSYSRTNISMLDIDYFNEMTEPIDLTPAQQELIQTVELDITEEEAIICAYITFYDGATLSVDYLREDYLETYNQIMTGQAAEYMIDFEWPEGNTVNAKRSDLFGDSITLTSPELEWSDYYYVYVQSDDGTLNAITGALLIVEDDYYYADFAEAGIENLDMFSPYDCSELLAHNITNEVLISDIMAAQEAYYEDDFGFLYDDSLSYSISTVFMFLVFGILPLISLILFLILAIRSKTGYRKFFRVIYLLSLAELVVFAIAAGIIMII